MDLSHHNVRVPVYLDGHASTPLAKEAAEAMAPYWTAASANAQSPHSRGLEAARAVEEARGSIANLIGAGPQEIVFVSGATEANNLILFGVTAAAEAAGDSRRKIVASSIEHKSVLAPLEMLRRRGWEIAICPVLPSGLVDLDALSMLVDESTLLVTVMGANNEIGVRQPLEEVCEIAARCGAATHSDLAQVAGKVPVNVGELGLDYASLSAHKFHGPMGIGATYISAAALLRPLPLIVGGGQESGLRAGSVPVPLIVGAGAAARVATAGLSEDALRQRAMVDSFLQRLGELQVRFTRNGEPDKSLPGSLSLIVPNISADDVVERLSREVCISTGSACSAGQILPSHVLVALGLNDTLARSTFRFYFDKYIDIVEVDFAASAFARATRDAALATGRLIQ